MVQNAGSIHGALSIITSLFCRLTSVLLKRLSHSWLAANTIGLKDPTRKDDAVECDLSSLGDSCHHSDRTVLQLHKLHVSKAEGHLEITHRLTMAELYVRKQLVADRVHACLREVEAAKKHYVESQRAFFQASDEHEEVEKLIKNLEEDKETTPSSQESKMNHS